MILLRNVYYNITIIAILVGIFNVYVLYCIIDNDKKSNFKQVPNFEKEKKVSNITNSKVEKNFLVEDEIKFGINSLPSEYLKKNKNYINIIDNLLEELKIERNSSYNIQSILNQWPNSQQLTPTFAKELGTIIDTFRRSKIIKADITKLGTQLKIMLTFENNVQGIFKPQWYERNTKIIGPVYHGKDRHNAEVVAFHLSSLLSLRRVPIAFIRKINLYEEIKKNASPSLLSTIYNNGSSTCLYGVCYYCTPLDPVCGKNNILEGSIILWLPKNLKLAKYRNPWQRTYVKNQHAIWEKDMNYCDKVKASKIYSPKFSNHLLDLIDTVIFDFLMDNGDRHHYESVRNLQNSTILLIDNGKSLGNPDIDHMDILAPLYQCCMIHKTTWERLKVFTGGSLSSSLKKLLIYESHSAQVLPIVTNEHLKALDRRLLKIFYIVEYCFKKNNYSHVIIGRQ